MTDEMKALCAAVERVAGAEMSPERSEAVVYAVLHQIEAISARLAAGTAQEQVRTAMAIVTSRITGGINLDAAVARQGGRPARGEAVAMRTRQSFGVPGLPG